MRPTGKLHLGHYLGVIDNWVKLQDEYDCYFSVADWHALTTKYDKTETTDSSSPSTVADALVAEGANGIPVWQSYCLGLNPKDVASVILCDAAAVQPSDGTVSITARNLNVPEGLSGVSVTAYLDSRTVGSDWSRGVASATVTSGSTTLDSPALASDISFFA